MTLGKIDYVIRRTAGDLVYFIGSLPTDKIKLATFVPAIEESETFLENEANEDYYQRPGKKSRMNKIKKYFQDNPNRLVPPVILSGRGEWVYSEQGEGPIGSLTMQDRAAIIDGQHRVGGLVALYEDTGEVREVDFVCFENLTLQQEIDEFVTINGEQTGVPKALNTFLRGGEDANIAWQLSELDESPFKDKIHRTGTGSDRLYALNSMEKNVKDSFNHGAFHSLEAEKKITALIKYWKLIAQHNAEAWEDLQRPKKQQRMKLCELTGIIAWSLVAPQIFLRGWAPESRTFNWEEIGNVIKFVGDDIDWDKEGEYGGYTGAVGGKRIAQELEAALGYYRG